MSTINRYISRAPRPRPIGLRMIMMDIQRYWGEFSDEKFYVISRTELDELLDGSPASPARAALRVKRIESADTRSVKAKWISYPGDAAIRQLGNNHYYFVLDVNISQWFGLETNAVAARIAKTSAGKFYVFFHRVRVNFREDGCTGGEGYSAGVRIP